MFRIIQPNTWYADPHGASCKILRATHEVIHYIRNGRTCIASIGRFQHEFEPLTKAQAERIAEEIETAKPNASFFAGCRYPFLSITPGVYQCAFKSRS
ncbi:DUF4222 domain-containing protein [Escherichia sp. TWPC-MK]